MAGHEVGVGGSLLADSAGKHGIGILRATRVGHAFHSQQRDNCGIRADREAAEDREAKHREVDLAAAIHPTEKAS